MEQILAQERTVGVNSWRGGCSLGHGNIQCAIRCTDYARYAGMLFSVKIPYKISYELACYCSAATAQIFH